MKRAILAIPIAAALLAGCESKKEICARAAAFEIFQEEAKQRLGLSDKADEADLRNYCEFYKG